MALNLVDELFAVYKKVVPKHQGRVVKTLGDGCLAEFDSAGDAVYCGVELQRILSNRNGSAPKEKRIEVRIGLHLGDVVHKDGDVFGDGVNIASRIQGVAEPGCVYLSQPVYDQVRNDPQVVVEDVGEEELKGQDEPLRIYRIVPPKEEALDSRGKIARTRRENWPLVAVTSILALGVLIFGFQLRDRRALPGPKQESAESVGRSVGKGDREDSPAQPRKDSKSSLDWRDKRNWRNYLKVGMTKEEVRNLFGEPTKMRVVGTSEYWYYEDGRLRGDIDFDTSEDPRGQLFAWDEPD